MAKIANYTMAAITLPRLGGQNKLAPAITIGPGMSIDVPNEIWTEVKKVHSVQCYLDAGLLKEIKKTGEVDSHISATIDTEAIVPEHLSDADEIKETAKATTAVKGTGIRRRSVSRMEI